MNNINDISNELESMDNILAGMSRKMPYTLPVDYMQEFSSELIKTISSLSENDLDAARYTAMPYAVPQGYFDQFSGEILVVISAEDFTAALPKEIPYTTPMGYFETLPGQILDAAKQEAPARKETKQIPIKPKTLFVPTRWAAAAVMLICITLGSYITFFSPAKSSIPEKMLASVPSNDIQDYFQHTYRLDASNIVGNKDLNNIQLDKKDIIRYLNENGWDAID